LTDTQSRSSPGSTWFKYLVKRYRLDHVREVPATFTIANFLTDPNYIQQIFVTSEPFFARKAGAPSAHLPNQRHRIRSIPVLVTTGPYAKSHPAVVAKFVRASLRGWQDYLRDPADAHVVIQRLNPAIESGADGLQSRHAGQWTFRRRPERRRNWEIRSGSLGRHPSALADLKVIDKPIDPSNGLYA